MKLTLARFPMGPDRDHVQRLIMIAMPRRVSLDRKVEGIIGYLLTAYADAHHVRRVASWTGFIALGIERLIGSNWWPSWSRHSVRFHYKRRRFQVKFRHDVGRRGSVVIEENPRPGGRVGSDEFIAVITNVREAEMFYLNPDSYFRNKGN